MKQSVILALSATLLVATGIAKPHNHQHLHKRDMVTVTVTEDVLEIVNVVVTVYNDGAATSTALSTTQTTRHGASSSKAAEPSSSSPLAALKLAPSSPSLNPPPNIGEVSSAKDNSPAQEDASAHRESSAPGGGSSPIEQQAENIRKQEEKIKAQNKMNAQQQKANEDQAKKNGAPQEKAAAPAVPEQKAATSQEDSKQATSGNTGNTHSGGSHSEAKSEGGNSGGASSSGGACGQLGGKCTAPKVTIYTETAAGTCGWTRDSDTDNFFALEANTMGPYANDDYFDGSKHVDGHHKNAFCGRWATISANGKKVKAELTDKCPGCQGAWSIDVSKHLWKELYGDEAYGFHTNVEYEFTTPQIWHPPRV